jgi:hypothetical protein
MTAIWWGEAGIPCSVSIGVSDCSSIPPDWRTDIWSALTTRSSRRFEHLKEARLINMADVLLLLRKRKAGKHRDNADSRQRHLRTVRLHSLCSIRYSTGLLRCTTSVL